MSEIPVAASDEQVFPDLYEASILELQAGLDSGRFSSVELVKAYFARIDEVNIKGPGLRAVIELNPSALNQAAELDKERAESGKRSLVHGIPVLLKDNIATISSEGMNTTAGSYSLLGSIVPDDAGVAKRLREAGAIFLGKANLSEFSGFRGERGELPLGWSGRGGQATSAYYPNSDPMGSSSGSGIAASIGLATVTLGTETNGSIIAPSSHNNIVGIKPTVGLTSRAGVIPVSSTEDSVGPMARSVEDAAIVLSIIAGKDPNDATTLLQPDVVPDYTHALKHDALKGKRIGVPRHVFVDDKITEADPCVEKAFNVALDVLRSLGATVVDPADLPSADDMMESRSEGIIMDVDFKVDINTYLAGLKESPTGVRSLASLIKFNNDNPHLEKPEGYELQGRLIKAEATPGRDAAYLVARRDNIKLGRTSGIDAVLENSKLDALVHPFGGHSFKPVAIAGYPIISVPLGFHPDNVELKYSDISASFPVTRAPGMPFGISFSGTAHSEFELIGFAFAYEQATKTRFARRAYPEAIPRTQLQDVVARVRPQE